MKSARVVLVPEHSSSDHQIYSSASDVDGRFTIEDIPSGRYRFFATHAGFVDRHYKADANDAGPLFSLQPAEKVTDVLFRLIAAAVITGRIDNEDGEAMQHVQVVALRRPTEEESEDEESVPRPRKIQMQPVASAESDDRGQYRIFGLKPGEYYVRAEDSFQAPGMAVPVDETFWVKQSLGSEYAPVYYPAAAQILQAQVIPIRAGEEVQADVVMHRVRTFEIAGRVIGANGPSAHAFVNLQPMDNSDSGIDRQDITDDKGAFRLTGIPGGSYYVSVHQRGEGTLVHESRARERVDIGDENIDSLTIALGGGTTIQGMLKIDGARSIVLDRIRVLLMSADEDALPGGHSEVKKDGTFEMTSVPDGNYTLSVWGLYGDAYVKSIRCGSDDVLEKGVQIENATISGKIEVTLSSDSAQVDGSVTDDEGAVSGAVLRFAPDPLTPYNRSRIRRETADQLGHFLLTAIAPGKYRVTARPMVSSASTPSKSEPQVVTLSAKDHKTIKIKLERSQEQEPTCRQKQCPSSIVARCR